MPEVNSIMDAMKASLVHTDFLTGTLRKQLLDNLVADAKATSTSLKTVVDANDVLIQALSQTAGSDCFSLS